jgi:hypothetical protein
MKSSRPYGSGAGARRAGLTRQRSRSGGCWPAAGCAGRAPTPRGHRRVGARVRGASRVPRGFTRLRTMRRPPRPAEAPGLRDAARGREAEEEGGRGHHRGEVLDRGVPVPEHLEQIRLPARARVRERAAARGGAAGAGARRRACAAARAPGGCAHAGGYACVAWRWRGRVVNGLGGFGVEDREGRAGERGLKWRRARHRRRIRCRSASAPSASARARVATAPASRSASSARSHCGDGEGYIRRQGPAPARAAHSAESTRGGAGRIRRGKRARPAWRLP